jgi:hypothetical protein
VAFIESLSLTLSVTVYIPTATAHVADAITDTVPFVFVGVTVSPAGTFKVETRRVFGASW